MKSQLAKRLTLALLLGIVLLPLTVSAQTSHRSRSINARQRHQQQRIRQGIRNEELTRREAIRLEQRQARIAINERYARRSGGKFTARERARIQRQQNRASRSIYRQKHDRQDRN